MSYKELSTKGVMFPCVFVSSRSSLTEGLLIPEPIYCLINRIKKRNQIPEGETSTKDLFRKYPKLIDYIYTQQSPRSITTDEISESSSIYSTDSCQDDCYVPGYGYYCPRYTLVPRSLSGAQTEETAQTSFPGSKTNTLRPTESIPRKKRDIQGSSNIKALIEMFEQFLPETQTVNPNVFLFQSFLPKPVKVDENQIDTYIINDPLKRLKLGKISRRVRSRCENIGSEPMRHFQGLKPLKLVPEREPKSFFNVFGFN